MTSVLPAVLGFHGTCKLEVGADGSAVVTTWVRVTFDAAPASAGRERVKAAWKHLADVTGPARTGFRRESVQAWWDIRGREARFRVVDREGPAGG